MSTSEHPAVRPLTQARWNRNLTQRQAAEDAGIGLNTFKRAERGEPVSLETCRRLSRSFGMGAEELGLAKEQQPLTQPKEALAVWTHVQAQVSLPMSEQSEMGLCLALSAGQMIPLIEAGLSFESLSTVFPLILKVVENMPKITRRQLMLLGAAAMIGSAGGNVFLPTLEQENISASKRDNLTVNLGESISQGWQQFHHNTPEQTLLLSQAQLLMVQQSHHHLHPAACPFLYSGAYRLMGAALFFQARYPEAQTAHQRAYITSVESGDAWNIAQSLAWQAYSYQANQDHLSAMQTIEKALRLLDDRVHENEMDIRLKSHLLALWAENANINANGASSSNAELLVAQKRLEESAHLLDRITPNEEFDRLHWLQISGKCALEQKKFKQAIAHFEEALATLSPSWFMRYALASVPLATAYARSRERDASLTVARKMLPMLATLKAPIMNDQFATYIQELEQIFPADSAVEDFMNEELHSYLPLLGISRQ